jgi:hypothetical protein
MVGPQQPSQNYPVGQPGVTSTKTRVVCICGSMRFEHTMRQAAIDESLSGAIVVMPLVNMRHTDDRWSDPDTAERVKSALDRLHVAKIDLADEVLVICPGDYIGESTAREINHARQTGKPVRYWRAAAFSDLCAMHDPWCLVWTTPNGQLDDQTCDCRGDQ